MESKQAGRGSWLSWLAIAISLFSAAAAIFSCIFAYQSLSTSKSQFKILNQGYLNVKPELHITVPNNEARLLTKVSKMNDDLLIDGLNPKLKLENVGKIPLKYDVEDFSIFLNDKEYQRIEQGGRTTGVIYPEQTAIFELATVPFDHLEPTKTIRFGSLKNTKIKSTIKIAYSNIGSENRIKYCDRKLHWTVYDNFIKYVWTDINDKI